LPQTPLPVEPLSYEQFATADADERAIRALAIVGMIVGSSRVGLAFYYAWVYGLLLLSPPAPYRALNVSFPQNALMIANSIEGAVVGLLLVIGAAGLFRRQQWGWKLVLMIELAHVGLRFGLTVLQGLLDRNPAFSTGEYLLTYVLGVATNLLNAQAFSLVAILILWRRRPMAHSLGQDS
jgi:hypothetical protein